MDLLEENSELSLFDYDWRIYSVNSNHPPQYISPDAAVSQSLINEGCMIEGDIHKSVLFQGVTVGNGTVIRESVVMPGAVVGKNVLIEKAIVPPDINIPDGTVIRSLDGKIVLVTEDMLELLAN